MHAITEGSAARIGDSRVRSTQMAEEDKWIVGSRNSASGLLVRPNLLLIIARGSSLGLINCPISSTFMQLNVQGGALHSGGPSAAALLDPPQGRAWAHHGYSDRSRVFVYREPVVKKEHAQIGIITIKTLPGIVLR